jgi:hypothetical protein
LEVNLFFDGSTPWLPAVHYQRHVRHFGEFAQQGLKALPHLAVEEVFHLLRRQVRILFPDGSR